MTLVSISALLLATYFLIERSVIYHTKTNNTDCSKDNYIYMVGLVV